MISKIFEREKIGFLFLLNRLNDLFIFKKLDESFIFKFEFIGYDSYDSNKELDFLFKVKSD